jgi:hypothetical protein
MGRWRVAKRLSNGILHLFGTIIGSAISGRSRAAASPAGNAVPAAYSENPTSMPAGNAAPSAAAE